MAPGLLSLPVELLTEIFGHINEDSRVFHPAQALLALNDTCRAFRILARGLVSRTPRLTFPHRDEAECAQRLSIRDIDIDGVFDSLVLADLDFDHSGFIGDQEPSCAACKALAGEIVSYLFRHPNPFPSLVSLSMNLPSAALCLANPEEGRVTKFVQILEQFLRAPKLRHVEVFGNPENAVFPLPPIPARIAVEIYCTSAPDGWLECVLKSVGQLRTIASDDYRFCNGMKDLWAKDLQGFHVRYRESEATFLADLTAASTLQRFANEKFALAPYVSTLACCYELGVDFVDRSLTIELLGRDSPKLEDVIRVIPALYPRLKSLRVGVTRLSEDALRILSNLDDGLKGAEMFILTEALASLPDLRQIFVDVAFSATTSLIFRGDLDAWLHMNAGLCAEASDSVRVITLYFQFLQVRAQDTGGEDQRGHGTAVFDVTRRGDVGVTLRSYKVRTFESMAVDE